MGAEQVVVNVEQRLARAAFPAFFYNLNSSSRYEKLRLFRN